MLQKIEEELHVDNTKRLSSCFDDREKVKRTYISTFDRDWYLFIISFSSCRDTLPMWSMYGQNGKGLCLCFDKEENEETIDDWSACPDYGASLRTAMPSEDAGH